MLDTYAPFVTAYWSQLLAVVVGFVVASFVRPSRDRDGSDSSRTGKTTLRENNNIAQPPLANGDIDRLVDNQTKLESCEPNDAGDTDETFWRWAWTLSLAPKTKTKTKTKVVSHITRDLYHEPFNIYLDMQTNLSSHNAISLTFQTPVTTPKRFQTDRLLSIRDNVLVSLVCRRSGVGLIGVSGLCGITLDAISSLSV